MAISSHIIKSLQDTCGRDAVLIDSGECWAYGYDNSKQHACPEAVLLPSSHEQIVHAVKLCNQNTIPITTRGRGTGTTGAAVPLQGGLVLSTERLNQILEFDDQNRNICVQTGVLNSAVQNFVKRKNLFWPPDPSSADFCSIGGNLACNAAGPRAIKYGTCRENTLSVKAVTGIGDTIHSGSATTKGVVGLDLTRLLIGSEGTLAIITEARLKLSPTPEEISTIRAIYNSATAAIEGVVTILSQNNLPYALEFVDQGSLRLIQQHSSQEFPENANAMLLIEVDGLKKNITANTNAVRDAAKNTGCIEIQQAKTLEQKQQLWSARKALSPALRSFAPNKINEDVVVPVSKLPSLLETLETLSKKYNVSIFNFGHAGNGNLHVNILFDANNTKQNEAANNCLNEIFEVVLKLGGTLSGEHGIGMLKRDFVAKEIDAATLEIMRKIKQQFDPNSILNPGKSIPAG